MIARVIVTSKGAFSPRWIDSVTSDPGTPRNRSTASRKQRVLERFTIRPDDVITGFQARPLGRRTVDRRDDIDIRIALANLDAQTAEPAPGLFAKRLQMLLVQIAAVIVERSQHAVDSRLDKFLVLGVLRFRMTLADFLRRRFDKRLIVDVADVMDADLFVNLGKQVRAHGPEHSHPGGL